MLVSALLQVPSVWADPLGEVQGPVESAMTDGAPNSADLQVAQALLVEQAIAAFEECEEDPGYDPEDGLPILFEPDPIEPIPDPEFTPPGQNNVPPPMVAGPDPIPDPTVVAVVTQQVSRPTEEEPIEVPLDYEDIPTDVTSETPTLDTAFLDTAIVDIKRLGDQMRNGIISGQAAFDRLIEIESALYEALMEYEKQGGDINDLADLIAEYQFRRSLMPSDLANGGGGGVYPSGSTGGSSGPTL